MTILSSISLIIFILTIVLAFIAYKKKTFNFMYILIVGVFISIFCMMLFVDYNPTTYKKISTCLLALFHSVQIMLAGYDFELIETFAAENALNSFFIFPYMPFLFLCGPICTFGFVISFFKNFLAHLSYGKNYFSDMYIFSDVSQKALSLAASVKDKFPDSKIVFASSTALDDDDSTENSPLAKQLNAIFLKKDITDINLKFHSKNTNISFFAIKNDQSENVEDSLALIEKFNERKNTNLFVFSTTKESEILLDSAKFNKMKVRRINSVRSLAYSIIYNNPITDDFTVNENGEKVISTLIVGMGGYGTELTKALLWCGQLADYKLEINIIDKSPDAKSKFEAECPEIIKLNGNEEFGEARYNLNFYNAVDVECNDFNKILSELKNTSMVYISLGNDEKNIETAIKVRIQFERIGLYPKIRTIVYSDIRSKTLTGKKLVNFAGASYDIEIIGTIEGRYSYDVIMNKELEDIALSCHLRWANSPDAVIAETDRFNEHEYYRNSSIATAIHEKYRNAQNTPADIAEVLEHMRWNAYMRTEGYIFSGSPDKSSRNDRAKMHHNLHIQHLLSESDKNKDARMIKKS